MGGEIHSLALYLSLSRRSRRSVTVNWQRGTGCCGREEFDPRVLSSQSLIWKMVFLFRVWIGWMISFPLLHLTLAQAHRSVINEGNERQMFWWQVSYRIVWHTIRPTSIACPEWMAKRRRAQSLVTSVRWLICIRWAATKWCHSLRFLFMALEGKVVLASPTTVQVVPGQHKFLMTSSISRSEA